MKTLFTTIAILITSLHAVLGQSSFTYNLNFERANVQINNPTYGWLDWNLAVPSWNSSAPGSVVFYGSPHTGSTQWFLLVSSSSPTYTPNSQLAGNYSLAFSSGYGAYGPGSVPIGPWINASISQTLPISISAHSIQLLATGPFKVFLGDIEIPMLSLGGNSYGGDVTSFAGMTTELKIMNTAPANSFGSVTMVDNIVFSATIVPEPSSLALISLGSLTLFASLRRTGRK